MEKETRPIVYVALGDSTGVGVGARHGGGYVARVFTRIERVRPGSRLVNLCVSGATTADVLREQTERVPRGSATLVTLGVGTNDVGRQFTTEQFARNYEAIIQKLRERTTAPIGVTNIPDVSLAPVVPVPFRDEVRRRIRLFNKRIEEIGEHHGLLLVDVYETSHREIPVHPEFFSDDGFHPSDVGYEFWAKAMWPAVKGALGIEQEAEGSGQ